MEEYQIKTKVVGVDISNELTTYAIVDIRWQHYRRGVVA